MKKICFLLVLCVATSAWAGVPITVVNHSFEAPVFAAAGDTSRNWNDQHGTGVAVIDDWNYDYTGAGWPSANDTGVWWTNDAAPLDGTHNVSFVRHSAVPDPPGDQVTGPWQDLGYTIVAGETYTFTMDVRRHNVPKDDHAVSLTFNYHGAGVRTEIIENLIDITGQAGDTCDTYSVSFTAEAGQDYIGKSLGIEFNNESDDDSWHSFDDARVEQPFVANFYPEDGDKGIDVDKNLSWTLEASVTNCDVYFGTDPNMANNPKVVDAVHQESYDPPGDMDPETTYYWRIDVRVDGTLYEDVVEHNDPCGLKFTTTTTDSVIDEDPCGLTVNAGETAVFRVKATNVDSYLWKRLDGTPIPDNTGATLTISDVQKADEDVYWCELTNTAATIKTARVNLMTRRLVALWEFEDSLEAEDDEENACWPGDYVDPNTENPDPTPVYALDDPCSTGNGKSLQLAADELHVQITDSEDFFNFYPHGYTVNFWVKTEQTGEWGVIASKRIRGDYYFGWGLTCDDENKAESGLWQVENITGTSDIADNQWHMITATYDAGAGTGSVYVDGLVENQFVDASKAPINDQPVVIGVDAVSGAFPYEGLFDKFSIYSYALSQIDVALLYTTVTGDSLCVGGNPDYDLNEDCKVDILDFALFAADWLECNLVPDCLP